MRVSERQRYKITNTRVENARESNANMLDQISTLKRINRLADDPIGAGQVIRRRDRISNIQQFQQNAEFSKGYLDRAETAVRSIADNLVRAKELSITLANATYDDKSRESTAREVKQLINDVVQHGNASYANRFVFSGFRTSSPALSDDGQFLGDDGAVFLQVDDGDFRQINIQARQLFEASSDERQVGHYNMLDTLALLHDSLMTNDMDELHKAIDELDFQLQKTSSYQASIGALYHALESVGSRLEGDQDQSRGELAKIEEIDMFKGSSDFHRSESVLQSTLLASNKMLQPSLLNFMQ